MLVINQLFFLVKVLFISVFISIFIKYGLDNSLIQEATYLAPVIIFVPVVLIFFILVTKQNLQNKKE